MEKNLNLNKKLLALQKSVRSLAKNEEGFGYQYVSGSKLLYFIRPRMDELGLLLLPSTINFSSQIVKTREEGVDKKGNPISAKFENLVTITKRFTWVDAESGEEISFDFVSQGCNEWDKGCGSAETYAERYFLLKFFHIATDEDDVDAMRREETNATGDGKKKGTKSVAETNIDNADDSLLQDAIECANQAKSQAELTQVWKDWKAKFENEPSFVQAIKNNPNHPSHKQ